MRGLRQEEENPWEPLGSCVAAIPRASAESSLVRLDRAPGDTKDQ